MSRRRPEPTVLTPLGELVAGLAAAGCVFLFVGLFAAILGGAA